MQPLENLGLTFFSLNKIRTRCVQRIESFSKSRLFIIIIIYEYLKQDSLIRTKSTVINRVIIHIGSSQGSSFTLDQNNAIILSRN